MASAAASAAWPFASPLTAEAGTAAAVDKTVARSAMRSAAMVRKVAFACLDIIMLARWCIIGTGKDEGRARQVSAGDRLLDEGVCTGRAAMRARGSWLFVCCARFALLDRVGLLF